MPGDAVGGLYVLVEYIPERIDRGGLEDNGRSEADAGCYGGDYGGVDGSSQYAKYSKWKELEVKMEYV